LPLQHLLEHAADFDVHKNIACEGNKAKDGTKFGSEGAAVKNEFLLDGFALPAGRHCKPNRSKPT
jgi:hypothetical protein